MPKDFYQTLGVERKADEKEIKRAYRKLARQHHPDINPNDKGAEARFKEINQAYQVLSDKEKRELYDAVGDDYDKVPAGVSAEDFKRYAGGTGFSGSGNFPGGANLEDVFGRTSSTRSGGFRVETGGGNGGVGDLFENLFGGRGDGRSRQRVAQKGGDVEQPISISLAESIRGAQRTLQLTIRSERGEESRHVTVRIPPAVRDNARVRIANQGASGQNGGANGDLFLRVRIAPHAFWKRDGDDISCEIPIRFEEAALGATISVPTIENNVNLKIPAGTQSGQTFRLSGRGVGQKDGKAGDQFIKVKVVVPKDLNDRERELIGELKALRADDVRADLPKSL